MDTRTSLLAVSCIEAPAELPVRVGQARSLSRVPADCFSTTLQKRSCLPWLESED